MVPQRERALTRPGGRAIAAALAVALYVGWQTGFGLQPLPPPMVAVLPPVAAGLTIALLLSLIGQVTTPLAGVLAAGTVLAMPGFLPVHASGAAPALLLLAVVVMLVTMVHAPRWSLAYGALAAVTAVFLAPAAAGLPLVAITWAAWPHPANGRGRAGRVLLALVPLLGALILARFVGDAWPAEASVGWAGGLDRGLRAARTIIGDQLAPGIESPAVRFFAIADLSLLLIAVITTAWWRIARPRPVDAPLHRWYAAAGTLALGLAAGLAARRLLFPGTPEPELAAIFPLAVLGALAAVVSVAVWWPRWPRWGKLAALVLAAGWLQAALRA